MARNKTKGSTGGGSDKKILNKDEIYNYAKIGCTTKEIASLLHCSTRTLSRNYQDVIDEGHENLKQSIRRKQYIKAIDEGCTKTLDKMANVYLGQSQKIDVKSSGTLDINVNFVSESHSDDAFSDKED